MILEDESEDDKRLSEERKELKEYIQLSEIVTNHSFTKYLEQLENNQKDLMNKQIGFNEYNELILVNKDSRIMENIEKDITKEIESLGLQSIDSQKDIDLKELSDITIRKFYRNFTKEEFKIKFLEFDFQNRVLLKKELIKSEEKQEDWYKFIHLLETNRLKGELISEYKDEKKKVEAIEQGIVTGIMKDCIIATLKDKELKNRYKDRIEDKFVQSIVNYGIAKEETCEDDEDFSYSTSIYVEYDSDKFYQYFNFSDLICQINGITNTTIEQVPDLLRRIWSESTDRIRIVVDKAKVNRYKNEAIYRVFKIIQEAQKIDENLNVWISVNINTDHTREIYDFVRQHRTTLRAITDYPKNHLEILKNYANILIDLRDVKSYEEYRNVINLVRKIVGIHFEDAVISKDSTLEDILRLIYTKEEEVKNAEKKYWENIAEIERQEQDEGSYEEEEDNEKDEIITELIEEYLHENKQYADEQLYLDVFFDSIEEKETEYIYNRKGLFKSTRIKYDIENRKLEGKCYCEQYKENGCCAHLYSLARKIERHLYYETY